MTHRGLFQPLPFCDSVILKFLAIKCDQLGEKKKRKKYSMGKGRVSKNALSFS